MVFGTKKLKNMGSDLGGAVKGFKDGMKDGSQAPADVPAPPASVTNATAPPTRRRSTSKRMPEVLIWQRPDTSVIDLGISKMALIGAVALIVIGPEKLPRVARTVGTLLGKAQRYVADVKNEVNRSMELDELAQDEGNRRGRRPRRRELHPDQRQRLREVLGRGHGRVVLSAPCPAWKSSPEYKHPSKKWRLKQGATPQWYKARAGVRTRAQSGAARVARFRPQPGRLDLSLPADSSCSSRIARRHPSSANLPP